MGESSPWHTPPIADFPPATQPALSTVTAPPMPGHVPAWLVPSMRTPAFPPSFFTLRLVKQIQFPKVTPALNRHPTGLNQRPPHPAVALAHFTQQLLPLEVTDGIGFALVCELGETVAGQRGCHTLSFRFPHSLILHPNIRSPSPVPSLLLLISARLPPDTNYNVARFYATLRVWFWLFGFVLD